MFSAHVDDFRTPLPLLTLLDLVEAVSELTDDHGETVEAVAHLLSSGAVRRPRLG